MKKDEDLEDLSQIDLAKFMSGMKDQPPGEEEPGKSGTLEERVEDIEYQLKSLLKDLPMEIEDKIYPSLRKLAIRVTRDWLENNLRRKVSLWLTWVVVTFLLSLVGLNIFWIVRDLAF